MRVLFISSSEPGNYLSGGSQRSNYIRDALLTIANVDTIVVGGADRTSAMPHFNAERVAEVRTAHEAGRYVRFKQFLAARKFIKQACRDNLYDLIVVRYLHTTKLIPFSEHEKLIIDADDFAKSDVGGSVIVRAIRHLRSLILAKIIKRTRHTWIVDLRDAYFFEGRRFSYLPNTAVPTKTSETSKNSGLRILMVGSYWYSPNEEGLVWFATKILPRVRQVLPGVEFHAVGAYYKSSLAELGPGVHMRGFVDNLAEQYANATLVICPVFSGSGTQIKIVEALLADRPLVASKFSFAGFSNVLVAGEHLLVAETEDEWVAVLIKALKEPERLAAMARAGKEAAESAFGIERFKQHVIDTALGIEA